MFSFFRTQWTCRRVRRRLPLLVGGDLTGREQLQVEAHVASCERCRQELCQFEQSAAALQALAESDAALAIPSVLPELRRRLATPRPSSIRREHSFSAAALALLGSLSVTAIVVGTMLVQWAPPGRGNGPSAGAETGGKVAATPTQAVQSSTRQAVAAQLDMAVLASNGSPTSDETAVSDQTQCRYTLDLATPMDAYEPALDEY